MSQPPSDFFRIRPVERTQSTTLESYNDAQLNFSQNRREKKQKKLTNNTILTLKEISF